MTISIFDSEIYKTHFVRGNTAELFSDASELRTLLTVEGALAKVQGEHGIIPNASAVAIHRAASCVEIKSAEIAISTEKNGIPIPGLVTAFRDSMNSPEHSQYIHWGATSQDIMDTGLMLRLRSAFDEFEQSLLSLLGMLAELAGRHSDLPMLARTYGQGALPTSFGCVVTSWGWPLLDAHKALDEIRQNFWVSLSGAAGTALPLGSDADQVRTDLACELKLLDPKRSWHSDRGPYLRTAAWLSRIVIALAKIGEDIGMLSQSGIEEVYLSDVGASSTMPQKKNPVMAATLVAINNQVQGAFSTLSQSGPHRQQRDGSAWFTEWMTLPTIVVGAGSALEMACKLLQGLSPQPDAMAASLAERKGLILSEALAFSLAKTLPRPQANAIVKALCNESLASDMHLKTLVARDWPEIDTDTLFDPSQQLGMAPVEARNFVEAVQEKTSRK
ncbi:MAG: adenylosuccinate lyase family protein [Aestuariivita sp.]|nr:adenylosuccinate lyase family protein [Aestuariivita sp.]MCY4202953.1 adenylosuccinate lyase family protein [Aestuariivita sp.]